MQRIMIIKLNLKQYRNGFFNSVITFKAQNSNNKSPFLFIDGSNEHLLLDVFQNIMVVDNTLIHDAR